MFKRLTSKSMNSSIGKLIIEIHILFNINRSKGNHTMSFGENMVKKLILDPSLQNRYRAYFWINSLKFSTVCFHCMSMSRTNKMYWNYGADNLFLFIQTFVKRQKEDWNKSSWLIFCMDFEEKYFSHYICYLLFKCNYP